VFPLLPLLVLSSSSSLSSRQILLLSFLSRLFHSLPSSSPEPSKKRNQRSIEKRTDGLNSESGYEWNPWVPKEGEERRFLDFPSPPPIVTVGGLSLVATPGQKTRRERGRGTNQIWVEGCGGGAAHLIFFGCRYSVRQQCRPTMCPSPRLRLPPLSSTANARV